VPFDPVGSLQSSPKPIYDEEMLRGGEEQDGGSVVGPSSSSALFTSLQVL
jgi:hypothetical protein